MTLDYFYGQAGKLFSFYRIPKALFQEQRFQNLSTDAKTLYGILLDRMSLSVKNEWFDKQGRVFIIFTIEDVKRTLRCADNKATKLLRELENFGLIERKRRGLGKPSLVYAPPEVVDGKPPLYPYTPIKSSFEDAGSVEDMMLYTELEAAVHAMIQRLEYSFTFNPSLLTIPKRKQQVAEILKEAETYIWRIKEEMRCA